MNRFDHAGLIQNINDSLAPMHEALPETMQAFGQLARAVMAEGVRNDVGGKAVDGLIGSTPAIEIFTGL